MSRRGSAGSMTTIAAPRAPKPMRGKQKKRCPTCQNSNHTRTMTAVRYWCTLCQKAFVPR